MTVHAVLLVPAEGDPHGLLREGPCGTRPPMAGQIDRGTQTHEIDGKPIRDWYGCHMEHVQLTDYACPEVRETALVLAWDGAPVPEGMCRALLCVAEVVDPDVVWPADDLPLPRTKRLSDVILGLDNFKRDLGVTAVLLDAEGHEVTS